MSGGNGLVITGMPVHAAEALLDKELTEPVNVWVGGAGNVQVVTPYDETVTFPMLAGQVVPVQVKKIVQAGTDATNLRMIW